MLPIFIHNENDIYSEGDGPFPENTPSTGSISNRNVVARGNRVLELMERQKNATISRTAHTKMVFKKILENARNGQSEESGPTETVLQNNSSALPSQVSFSAPGDIDNDASGVTPDRLNSREALRTKTASRVNISLTGSDEYLDPPESVPWVNRSMSTDPAANNDLNNSSNRRESSSTINSRNNSRSSLRNTNNSTSRGSVTFADHHASSPRDDFPGAADTDPCCCGNNGSPTSMENDLYFRRKYDFDERDSQNNVRYPSYPPPSLHASSRKMNQQRGNANPVHDTMYVDHFSNEHIPSNIFRQRSNRNPINQARDNSPSTSQEFLRGGRNFRNHPANYSPSAIIAGVDSSLSTLSASASALRQRDSTSSSQHSLTETIRSARTVIPAARSQPHTRNSFDASDYMWHIFIAVILVLLLFGLLFTSLEDWKNVLSLEKGDSKKIILYGPIM